MKKSSKIILAAFLAFFCFYHTAYSIDKEEIKEYVVKINPVLINVQATSRNLSQKLLPLEGAVIEMQNHIDAISSFTPPESMKRQHKMILLSFKKLRMGFYLLSRGNRSLSVKLVRRGSYLLRMAAKNILELSKKEGIIKESYK